MASVIAGLAGDLVATLVLTIVMVGDGGPSPTAHLSRAGYYPEGGTMRVTLTVDEPSGRVLGGSLVFEYGEGAVHRSHALVGAVTEGISVDELPNYNLTYAPPFNTTWNPVLTAAKVLSGKR